MTVRTGSRQHQILELLLKYKEGLSINEVATHLEISRNAVQQHFKALEKDGFIQPGALHKTAGRPVRRYVLSSAGINYFPKQYAWFSELILANLKQEMGPEAFKQYMQKLGNSLSQSLLPKFAGQATEERISILVKTMVDLGYQASYQDNADASTIEASNCIYHDLAQSYDEVCELDKTLISTLLGKPVELVECMTKGGHCCKFKIIKNNTTADK